MTTRFEIDLTRPGASYRSRWDWFVGASGPRNLAVVAAGGLALLLLVGLGGVLPRSLRYSSDLQAVARLKQDVVRAGAELDSLRANLRDLSAESRRQVRWAEVLPVLSRRLPDPLRIERASLSSPRPATPQPQPGAPAATAPPLNLQIEAAAPLVPGGGGLVDVANLMAGLAQDPAIAPQFQLTRWEVKPRRDQAGAGSLQVIIGFTEKRS